MLILIEDKTILSKDKLGNIKCDNFRFSPLSIDQPKSFINKQEYKSTIETISNKLEKFSDFNGNDTLIICSEYYQKPGFEEALTEHFRDKILIKPEVELALQNFSSGEYLFVDMCKEFILIYEISLNGNTYSIGKRTIQNNDSFILNLVNNFRMYMLPDVEKEELLEVLFDYSNIIALNNFLTDGKYAIMSNENSYEDINLYFKDSKFKTIFNTDLVLSVFFNVLANSINKQIDDLGKSKELILQSPLLDYLKIADMIDPNDNLYLANKLRQFENFKALTFVHKKVRQDIEIDLYPFKQKTLLPFKSWILIEASNLSLSFSKNESVLSIDFSAIKEPLTDTIFSIGNRELLKYHVYIDTDSIGNIYSRITDLNGKQYCKLLNN